MARICRLFLACGALASALLADLPVGPVYLDEFPTIDVVAEPPGLDPEALAALEADDFELLEDGEATSRAVRVRPFEATGRGIALVVAIDVSGTMTGKPLAEMKKALVTLVEQIGPEDRMALVTFADEFRQENEFTSDAEELRGVIEGLEARGRITELFKALYKSLGLLETAGLPARRRLVVVSDGKDEGEAYQLEDVIERAQDLHVPVDGIGLTRIDPKYLSQLERLSDLSGGLYSRASEAEELERLFGDGMRRVQATPVATFEARRLTRDGQPHSVGVRWRADGRALEGDVQVLLPSPPPPPPEVAVDEPEPVPEVEPDMAETDALAGPALWAGVVGLLGLLALWLIVRRRAGRHDADPEPSFTPPPRADAAPADDVRPTETGPGAADPGVVTAPTEKEPVPAAARRKTRIRVPFTAPAEGRPAAVLRGLEASETSIGIEADPFWIGTEEANHLRIEDDDYVSSHHACIRFHEGSLLVYDNTSTNGSFLNEERLADTPRPLTPGDRLRFGRTTFVVLSPADGSGGESLQ